MMMKRINYLLLILLPCFLYGCEKFLDEKPRRSLMVPETAEHFQALLDQYTTINIIDPPLADIVADEIYLTETDLAARDEYERLLYLRQKGNLYRDLSSEWNNTFRPVFTANTVLEGVVKHGNQTDREWRNITGQAYYLRAKCYLQAVNTWSLAYDEATAGTDLGLPLRLSTDFNEKSVRSTLAETYGQIISDLKGAIELLDENPLHVMRFSKPAAYGLLARTYLAMRNYQQAGLYADSCLQLKNDLQDFNELDTTLNYPFRQFNKEVLAQSSMSAPALLATNRAKIMPDLLSLYDSDDLRMAVYFNNNGNGTFHFGGSYNENNALFSGIATNEIYLIRAECYARAGEIEKALGDINHLLVRRYKRGSFTEITVTDQSELVTFVLTERRRELVLRGIRWMDIKRLNKEGSNIILRRTYGGSEYRLEPNASNYALSIPEDIIALTGMQQN